MVELLDTNIGRILKMLEADNLTENTFVIFTSDNGGDRMASLPSPLRARKGSFYEGGLRVPLLMRWPEKIKQGINSTPAINLIATFEIININTRKVMKTLMDKSKAQYSYELCLLLLRRPPALNTLHTTNPNYREN